MKKTFFSLVLLVLTFVNGNAFAASSMFICKSTADAVTALVGPVADSGCFNSGKIETFGWKEGSCGGETTTWRNCQFTDRSLTLEAECGAHGSCVSVSLDKTKQNTWVGKIMNVGDVSCQEYIAHE